MLIIECQRSILLFLNGKGHFLGLNPAVFRNPLQLPFCDLRHFEDLLIRVFHIQAYRNFRAYTKHCFDHIELLLAEIRKTVDIDGAVF